MCGIAGLVGAETPPSRETLTRMVATLAHRGPDDCGEWWSPDGRVGLGHRRLAIIDLSPAGHQPMHDPSGRVSVILNGEIYNYQDLRADLVSRGHRFRSASDTEVLLTAYLEWGEACLDRLDGMFAFGLYDAASRRLLLARDRAGEKPLYYTRTPAGFAFASELKALVALSGDPEGSRYVPPPALDVEALDYYLTYGYVPGEMSMFRGFSKLPAAHALSWSVDRNEARTWQYWTLPASTPDPRLSAGDLAARLESLLESAVTRQLVADVPLGILLSGGVDSSLITAMAARVSAGRPKTFTVTFPGHSRHDEAPFARAVASHFGTDHTELRAEDVPIDLLPELAKQFDEPIADSAIVPTALLSRLMRQHVTVALGGDGGDELFGGYPHYGWLLKLDRLRRATPAWLRRAGAAAGRALPPGTRGRHHLIGLGGDVASSISHVNVYFDRAARRRLLVPDVPCPERARLCPERYRESLCPAGASVLRQATEADFRSTLADGYLVKVDRASMRYALEIRAPWLDRRIVEFAFGEVPDHLRATARERKILPKLIAKRLLPPGFDLRRKQGFTMPLDAWFAGRWGDQAIAILRDAPRSLFHAGEVDRLIRAQRRGWSNTNRIFALTMFELWRREYGITA